jgi:hypothetical protein
LISGKAISLIDGYVGNNSLTVGAFNVPTTLETGTVTTGWVSQRARTFDAYGPVTSTASFLYALANHTLGNVSYVLYDNESWSMTPSNEQADPGTYMSDFVGTAHANGLKAILAPSLDLTTKMTSCDVSAKPSWENYLTNCDLPALVGAAAPDVYSIQAQSLQNDTSSSSNCGCYDWFVAQAAAEAQAVNPIGQVLGGLSTNPEGSTTSGATMYSDTTATMGAVSGYWLNVPEQSSSCPTCQPGGVPGVAVDYLALLGYTASGVQSITFTAPASGSVGGGTTLSATGGNSGNPVVFSIDPSSGTGVCSLSGPSGADVTYNSAGSCIIDANQAGNSIWQPAQQVSQTTSVGPGGQTISFTAPGSGIVGGQATLSATGGNSGNPVVFSLDPSSGAGVCSLSGTNGSTVAYSAVGSCVIDANQAGNANWAAAQPVTQTIGVGQGSQTIGFTSLGSGVVGGQATLSASGGPSGNPVVFSLDPSSGAGVCSLSGTNGSTVTYSAVGNCVIDANQAGNANWAAATQVSQMIIIGAGSQAITFTAPGSGAVGTQATLSASGGPSGNPVVFSLDPSSGAGVCSLSGTNGSTVTYSAVGYCVIDANQAGNANWTAAQQVIQPISVGQGSQTIGFISAPPTSATYGGTYTVTAAGGGSGNPVVFSSGTPAVCSLSGATLSFVGTGTCTILADEAGNANWTAAPEVSQSFTVAEASQTIAFTSAPPASAAFGGPAYDVAATGGGSGNPVLFSSGTPSVCAVTGSTVSFVGVGTCTVLADQAGNPDWSAAPEASQNFTVVEASQAITFTSTPPANVSFGGPVYDVFATGGGSGNPVIFSSATPSVCTVSGSAVSFAGAGSCVIEADEAGNSDWAPAPEVNQTFTVGQASQAITLVAPGAASVGGHDTLSATGGASGNPVVFSLDSSSGRGVCSLSGVNGASVSYASVGSCVVDANQAGNTNYSAAHQVSETIVVGPGSQSITFTAPGAGVVGGQGTLSASGGPSGNAVVFTLDSSSGAGVCSLSGPNGSTVSYAAAGDCVVDANQAGNANYTAAPAVQQTIVVGPAAQSISFPAPSTGTVGGGAVLSATGGPSGNPVVFTIDSSSGAGVCSVSGPNGSSITYAASGSCIVDANQAGNSNYLAAPEVSETIAVLEGTQSITFTSTPPASPTFGGTYDVSATGGPSGNPVVFSSGTPSVCAVPGSTVSFVGAGVCTVLADQGGNSNWAAAPEVSQSITVLQATQTIAFTSTPPANAVYGGPGYTVSATGGGSGNQVVFSSATPTVCAVTGNAVSFAGAGTCVIDANQAGNSDYATAPQVAQNFTVAQASQAITFTSTAPPNAVYKGPSYTVTAVGGGSGKPVTFSSATSGVCAVSGATVTFVGVGSCTVDANQSGNSNWSAAPQVAQTFAVAQASQAIKFTSTPPPHAKTKSTYTVTATGGGSGNPVVFSSGTPSVCTVKASTVSLVSAGTCTVDANQAGNTDWAAAPQATQSFSVARTGNGG